MDDEKKKVKQAIALEYDPSDEAPRVVASGKGILAAEMIPPELYEVVAEILVFVDAVDHRMVKENVADGGKHKN